MHTTTLKAALVLTVLTAMVRAQAVQTAPPAWPGYQYPPAAYQTPQQQQHQQQQPSLPGSYVQQQQPYSQPGGMYPYHHQQQQAYVTTTPQPAPQPAPPPPAPPAPAPDAQPAPPPQPQQPAQALQLEPQGAVSSPDGSHSGSQLFKGEDSQLYVVDWSYPRYRMPPNGILLKKYGAQPPEYVAMYRLRGPASAEAAAASTRYYGSQQRYPYDPLELIPPGENYVHRTL